MPARAEALIGGEAIPDLELTPIQSNLHAILADALDGAPGLRPDDDLFAIGADSIVFGQVMNSITALYGVELSPEAVFGNPTIAGLANLIEAALEEAVGSLTDEEAEALLHSTSQEEREDA